MQQSIYCDISISCSSLYNHTLIIYSSLLTASIAFRHVTPLHFRCDIEYVTPKKRKKGKFIQQIYNTALNNNA